MSIWLCRRLLALFLLCADKDFHCHAGTSCFCFSSEQMVELLSHAQNDRKYSLNFILLQRPTQMVDNGAN